MQKALIIGINGQDGSYLAKILVAKGYDVHGIVRKTASGRMDNIASLKDDVKIHYGDLTDATSLYRIITEVKPDEIYNEADQDHVGVSFEIPTYNCAVSGAAVGSLLEIVKQVAPNTRFFQPVTSNIFGLQAGPQDEETTLAPRSPYACAKAFALHLCHMYRAVYGLHVCVAIFFNHESERRTEHYVTRKITRAAARIRAGLQSELVLGNTAARIDWGYAEEYMEAAWRLMQLERPETVVIGTGETFSVRDFAERAFAIAGLDLGRHLRTDPALARPSQTGELRANAAKARRLIGFEPQVRFAQVVERMMRHDLAEHPV